LELDPFINYLVLPPDFASLGFISRKSISGFGIINIAGNSKYLKANKSCCYRKCMRVISSAVRTCRTKGELGIVIT